MNSQTNPHKLLAVGMFTLVLTLPGIPLIAEAELEAQGVTEPFVDVTLSSMVTGTIAKVLFKEGDEVKKGDVLVGYEKRLEELEVARRKVVAESDVELKSAQDKLETVKLDLEATRRLYHSTKSISKEKLLEKELEHNMAEADVERAKIGKEIQKLDYEIAQEQLRRREIRSPFDGIVTKIFLHDGETADPGRPIVRVVETRICRFVSNIEARLVRPLQVGQPVRMEVDAGETPAICEGTISFISPVVDPASGLQEIKATFDNSKGQVRPGVSGKMYVSKAGANAKTN